MVKRATPRSDYPECSLLLEPAPAAIFLVPTAQRRVAVVGRAAKKCGWAERSQHST